MWAIHHMNRETNDLKLEGAMGRSIGTEKTQDARFGDA
jgi:hypothetical protein